MLEKGLPQELLSPGFAPVVRIEQDTGYGPAINPCLATNLKRRECNTHHIPCVDLSTPKLGKYIILTFWNI